MCIFVVFGDLNRCWSTRRCAHELHSAYNQREQLPRNRPSSKTPIDIEGTCILLEIIITHTLLDEVHLCVIGAGLCSDLIGFTQVLKNTERLAILVFNRFFVVVQSSKPILGIMGSNRIFLGSNRTFWLDLICGAGCSIGQ